MGRFISQLVSLRLVVQVSSEERKEVVHLSLKELVDVRFGPKRRQGWNKLYLLLFWIGDGVCKVIEGIAHLARGHRGGCILERLVVID